MSSVVRRLRDILARIGQGRGGPAVLAFAFALLTTPFVAASLRLPPLFEVDEGFTPPEARHALVIGGLASIGAALLGGGIGGLLVRTRPTAGAVLALAIAWPAAISLLPAIAAVLGMPFETAYSCFDTCGPMISSSDPWTGLGAYLVSLFVSALTVVPIGILLLCVFGAYRLNRSGYPFVATVLLGIGYGSIHVLSFLAGSQPIISFVLLAVGVATWTWALRPSGTLTPP